MFHELRRDVKFALEGFRDAPPAAKAHLLERDLEARRAARCEGVEGFGCPFLQCAVALGAQCREDLFYRAVAEAAVDGGAEGASEQYGLVVRKPGVELLDRGVDHGEAFSERCVVLENELGEAGGEVTEAAGVDIVGRDTRVVGVDAPELLAGQREVGADVAVKAGKEEAAADVGEEADGGFGHGEDSAFGGNADRGVHGEANAAAHSDAVHVGDIGFWVGGDDVVELVFEAEVGFGLCYTGGAFGVKLGKRGDVAAGAEGSGAGAGYYDDGGQLGFFPFLFVLSQQQDQALESFLGRGWILCCMYGVP